MHLYETHLPVADTKAAEKLYREAMAGFALNKTVLRLPISSAVAENLPPALAETIPNLPAVRSGQTCAVVCSNFTCQPPIIAPDELRKQLTTEK